MKIKNRKQTINELKARRNLVIRMQKLNNYYYPQWNYTIGQNMPQYLKEIFLKIKQHHENKN